MVEIRSDVQTALVENTGLKEYFGGMIGAALGYLLIKGPLLQFVAENEATLRVIDESIQRAFGIWTLFHK